MNFRTVEELLQITKHEEISISEVMIRREMDIKDRTYEEVYQEMENNLIVMEEAIERGINGVESVTGLTGGDAVKVQEYMKNQTPLAGHTVLDAASKAMATNEVNAAMGVICATPTAGSAGCVPGVLFAVKEQLQPTREEMVRFLFTSGAFGFVVANNAMISGAAGGCQAEVGSAGAMASAAVVEMAGGTPEQSAEAFAMTLKNMLGLVCDPVAGLVEVPCVKRNAGGSSLAVVSADLALAGVTSRIPCDEVIGAMYKIGQTMPVELRETGEGGLADTSTGRFMRDKIFGTA